MNTLFDQDPIDTITARQEGIDRAEDHAPDRFKEAAFSAVAWCALTHGTFTADEVWDRLEREDVLPGDQQPSALGPVFLRAARAGLIRKTGEVRLSRNPRRHRDLTVWSRDARPS